MKFKNVVVLTGAGVSAESGIKTFRDSDGLWENHRIEDVATPGGFRRDPSRVYAFYNKLRRQLLSPELKPNPAHIALAEFEQRHVNNGGSFLLITQNIDSLHQRAGSLSLLAMHGELLKARCVRSGESQDWAMDLQQEHRCSCCITPSPMRPDVVWFNEIPYGVKQSQDAISKADLFISIGTSGQVYPAAGFAQLATSAGAHTVELNMEVTSPEFKQGFYGPASSVVPTYLNQILNDV